MTNILYLGMFDFLKVLLGPLWALVGLIFIFILIVLSRTIIKEAKKKQKGLKPGKIRTDFYREFEPYSEMPYVRITFDGHPEYLKVTEDDRVLEEEAEEYAIAAEVDMPEEKPDNGKAVVKKKPSPKTPKKSKTE